MGGVDGGGEVRHGRPRVLDPDENPALLATLRNDVVMLGLNLSRSFPDQPFRNFHDPSPKGQDYKIRHAFAGSPYYGAYMTDIIKDVVMLRSSDLMRHLAAEPSLVAKNIERLLVEFDDLGCSSPTVIAFGTKTHALAVKHLPSDRYGRLVGVTHYSHYIAPKRYRERVLVELAKF